MQNRRLSNTGYTEKKRPAWLYPALILLMGFWGYAFVAIKQLLYELSPVDLTVLRFLFVFVSIIAYMLFDVLRKRKPPAINRRNLPVLLILGFVGVFCYHLALNYGEQFVSANVASLIVFTSPVFTLVFSKVFLNESISFKKKLGIFLALTGAVIVVVSQNSSVEINPKMLAGALIVFISPLSWSLYTIFGRKYGNSLQGINRLYYSLYTMLFGSVFLMFFLRYETINALVNLSFHNLLNLLTLSILSSFLGYIIWVAALEYMTASELSAFLYLIPVYTQIFSLLFFREVVGLFFLAGAFLVFAGIYFVEKG